MELNRHPIVSKSFLAQQDVSQRLSAGIEPPEELEGDRLQLSMILEDLERLDIASRDLLDSLFQATASTLSEADPKRAHQPS